MKLCQKEYRIRSMRSRLLRYIAAALLFVLVSLTPGAEAKEINEHIYLIPAGNVDKRTMQAIKETLPENLPMAVKIEICPQEKIPESAYDPSRQQYNAETILNDILRRFRLDKVNESALVIVDVDLYSTGSDFVIGVSDASRVSGIMSLVRLRNEFYGQKPDNKLFQQRALKEAIRELGHACGVPDCPNPKCVMYFSGKLPDTDKKRSSMCHDCRKRAHERYSSALFKALLPVLK